MVKRIKSSALLGGATSNNCFTAVSYTHLDVYKRQHSTWELQQEVQVHFLKILQEKKK